jgi:hypothetical protein
LKGSAFAIVVPDLSSPGARFWRGQAISLARRLNFHHWLTRLIPKLAILLVIAAVSDLLGRQAGWAPGWNHLLLGLSILGVAGWSWLQARTHFFDWRQALVGIETARDAHNQLSAAADGVIPWPEPPSRRIEAFYILNGQRIFLPLAAGVLALAVAALMPVRHAKAAAGSEPISEPPDIAQVQSWVDALKADCLVQAEKLREMQATLDNLRDRPPQDWYTQGNLEAASSLKELAQQSMNSLGQNLDQADQSVQAMQAHLGDSSAGDSLQPMQDQLRAARISPRATCP